MLRKVKDGTAAGCPSRCEPRDSCSMGLIVEDPATGETVVPLLDNRTLADVASSIRLDVSTIEELAAAIRAQ